MKKVLMTAVSIAALLAGVTIASAQMDGRPADDKAAASQGQERNPNGSSGGSMNNPSSMGSSRMGTTGAGMSGDTVRPRQDSSSKGGTVVSPNGTLKGEVGGQAPEGH